MERAFCPSPKPLMENLRLTNTGHYTNGAMLLFSKDHDKRQLGSYNKIGFFDNVQTCFSAIYPLYC